MIKLRCNEINGNLHRSCSCYIHYYPTDHLCTTGSLCTTNRNTYMHIGLATEGDKVWPLSMKTDQQVMIVTRRMEIHWMEVHKCKPVPPWQAQLSHCFSKFGVARCRASVLLNTCTGTVHIKNLMGSKAVNNITWIFQWPDESSNCWAGQRTLAPSYSLHFAVGEGMAYYHMLLSFSFSLSFPA